MAAAERDGGGGTRRFKQLLRKEAGPSGATLRVVNFGGFDASLDSSAGSDERRNRGPALGRRSTGERRRRRGRARPRRRRRAGRQPGRLACAWSTIWTAASPARKARRPSTSTALRRRPRRTRRAGRTRQVPAPSRSAQNRPPVQRALHVRMPRRPARVRSVRSARARPSRLQRSVIPRRPRRASARGHKTAPPNPRAGAATSSPRRRGGGRGRAPRDRPSRRRPQGRR